MLQIENDTIFQTRMSVFPDLDGIDTVYPVIKATFDLKENIAVAKEQLPLVDADEYYGDDPTLCSIKWPSDTMPAKPATDFFLIGNAHCSRVGSVNQTDVRLSVGGRTKELRVFGKRRWEDGFFGWSLSKPDAFDNVPLCYEASFGGRDKTKNGDDIGFDQNPVGSGYCHPKGVKRPEELVPPQIEIPDLLVVRPSDSPRPAGFAPISPNWLPRLNFAGTYDESWQKSRSPYLPKDFDPRFFNVAPADQIFAPFLSGGERILAENVTPDNSLDFNLPKLRFGVTLRISGIDKPVTMNLDTVALLSESEQLVMIWHGQYQIDKKILKMEYAKFTLQSGDPAVKGL